jgi:SagB-type dehydrogenase family enzyme
MPNRDLDAAWTYHNATKHSYWSVRHDSHSLDWANQPLPFKIYPALPPLPLPREFPPTTMPALSAIALTETLPTASVLPDLPRLAALLHFSAGITKRRNYGNREIFYRAAACTGALYEIELYLVCAGLPDLPAGVYHFGPGDFALRLLRSGDYRAALVRATGDEPAVAHAPVMLVCTGTYWRNAWKYQARTYRHFGWDNGTILANLLAMCASLALPARVVLGFEDAVVNRLLGLDTQREVAFSLVPLGHTLEASPELPPQEIPPLTLETLPLSRTEVDYPAMRAMHAASELHSGREAAEWHEALPPTSHAISGPGKGTASAVPKSDDSSGTLAPEVSSHASRIPLDPLPDDQLPPDSVGEVILRRGSTRDFARSSISFRQLSTMLDRATPGIPADFPPLNDLYLIAHAVDGLASGAYFFHRQRSLPVGAHQGVRTAFTAGTLECLKEGDFRNEAGYLGLEQELPADASVAIFFLADLRRILDRLGNRGYRAVQLEAGILGGKLYLAAYAQRLGATGLTFYDDDVIKFFSPHAAGKSAIFLMAVGRSRKLRTTADS